MTNGSCKCVGNKEVSDRSAALGMRFEEEEFFPTGSGDESSDREDVKEEEVEEACDEHTKLTVESEGKQQGGASSSATEPV